MFKRLRWHGSSVGGSCSEVSIDWGWVGGMFGTRLTSCLSPENKFQYLPENVVVLYPRLADHKTPAWVDTGLERLKL